jgi:hypothetical protein
MALSWQCQDIYDARGPPPPVGPRERKTELVSFRATPSFKRALKEAAEQDQRSQANLLERLLREHCERLGITYHIPVNGKRRNR